jgi:hypothetical protein
LLSSLFHIFPSRWHQLIPPPPTHPGVFFNINRPPRSWLKKIYIYIYKVTDFWGNLRTQAIGSTNWEKKTTQILSFFCHGQDLINVLWSTRESATLHILVVHAQIILLTYGSAHSNSELFNNLLLMWFPPGALSQNILHC